MNRSPIPTATYRLQFNKDFTFNDAARIIPYLAELGISHIYASPFLKARAGSPHGYDIVDHQSINPEVGDQDSFERYVQTLHAHGLRQILDVVPNHVGVGGNDNHWWLDVLEHGECSRYAEHFDIDWYPVKEELQNRVLLPFLGDHYGKVLENGELKFVFDPAEGGFRVTYYEHWFPIDPRNYPDLLTPAGADLPHDLGGVCARLRSLPPHESRDAEARDYRAAQTAEAKSTLARLYEEQEDVRAWIDGRVAALNGNAGDAASFDALHELLQQQAYRLAYWKVAADEINYRRFFDINDLAGIRTSRTPVFEETHALIFTLIGADKIHGVRIDHPDGLYDPVRYYDQLAQRLRQVVSHSEAEAFDDNAPLPSYVVIEKILAPYEHLPDDWPVHGTTGYDFGHLVNGVLVYADSEHSMSRLYERFTGRNNDFEALAYDRKKVIIRNQLSSELTVLSNLLDGVAQAKRDTRDFTLNGLRDALTQVVASFPIYRTFIRPDRITVEDERFVQWAIAQAKKRSPSIDEAIYDFIQSLLLLQHIDEYDEATRRLALRFVMRFQQYTAPVMAKGTEDTAFYIYNRLVSLNEVGAEPGHYGVSVGAFHHANQYRQQHWPHSMLGTSTHDSKRGEDVRARIDVLSEIPAEWRREVYRWRRINRSKRKESDSGRSPSANDEYLLYQTLLGMWPAETPDDQAMKALCDRLEAYALKSAREAKVHTSWINPNQAYEEGLTAFIQGLLTRRRRNKFLDAFLPFQRKLAFFGALNSLTQTLLKLTCPGVPDIYQGNELWAFNLVDPDNRRPVDYDSCRNLLSEVRERTQSPVEMPALLDHWMAEETRGRLKLYLTWRTLQLRTAWPELFESGDYQPLAVTGPRAAHVVAFSRRHEGRRIVVVSAIWMAVLGWESQSAPLGDAWRETFVQLPEDLRDSTDWREHLTSREADTDGEGRLPLATVLRHLPVALLTSED